MASSKHPDSSPAGMARRNRERRFATKLMLVKAPLRAAITNLSANGMRIESSESLEVGRSYNFKVGSNGSRTLRVPGQIRWSRLTSTTRTPGGDVRPIYRSGVALGESVATRAWREALLRVTLNGSECKGDLTQPASAVYVAGYRRRDGTYVKGHYRKKSGNP